MRRVPVGSRVERRARALSVLFAEIVAGVGVVSCAPASPAPPDVAPIDPTPAPQPTTASVASPSGSSSTGPSPGDGRPPIVEVGAACDPGVKESRAIQGAPNLVWGLKPKEPVDYVELVLFGMREEGKVIMAAGKKCATAKDWRSCLSDVGRIAPAPQQGFRPGCIPGWCGHALVFTRGDDVSVISTAAGVAEFLGTIDTPSEVLLTAFANEWSAAAGDGHGTCDLAAGKGLSPTQAGGFELVATKTIDWCPISVATARIHVSPKGDVKEVARISTSKNGPCAGRRPPGFAGAPPAPIGTSPVGAYLLDLACLEAASIRAFAILASELGTHGAPKRLTSAALRARTDEIRHARSAARHARRYGAMRSTRAPSPRRGAARDLLEIACENEVEGCVREAFGALSATYQAKHASDPGLAAMFAEVAADETRHLALALELRDFFRQRLSPAERRRVERSRREAIATLRRDLRAAVDTRLTLTAGVPQPQVALALLDRLSRAV